eukprot:3937595-Rhodomonas_salina.1
MPEDFLPDTSRMETGERRARLDMDKWPEKKAEWMARVNKSLPEIKALAMEPLRELEAIWAMEYKHAYDLVGYMSGGNLPTVEGMNKTLRRLHWAAKQLSTAVNEAKDTRVFQADTVAMRRAAELVEGSIDAAFEQHTDSGPRKKSEKDKWDETWMKAYSAELEK